MLSVSCAHRLAISVLLFALSSSLWASSSTDESWDNLVLKFNQVLIKSSQAISVEQEAYQEREKKRAQIAEKQAEIERLKAELDAEIIDLTGSDPEPNPKAKRQRSMDSTRADESEASVALLALSASPFHFNTSSDDEEKSDLDIKSSKSPYSDEAIFDMIDELSENIDDLGSQSGISDERKPLIHNAFTLVGILKSEKDKVEARLQLAQVIYKLARGIKTGNFNASNKFKILMKKWKLFDAARSLYQSDEERKHSSYGGIRESMTNICISADPIFSNAFATELGSTQAELPNYNEIKDKLLKLPQTCPIVLCWIGHNRWDYHHQKREYLGQGKVIRKGVLEESLRYYNMAVEAYSQLNLNELAKKVKSHADEVEKKLHNYNRHQD